MTAPSPDTPLTIRSGYEPGAIGRIGELHGAYYAAAWGSGAAFEMQMLRELCDFVEHYDPAHSLLLTAHAPDRLVGALVAMLVAGTRRARLRFVIVDPAWQGRGAGRTMLNAALDWCRVREVETVFLWTVEGLTASRALYEHAGFRIVERAHDSRYSIPLTSLKLELTLPGRGNDAAATISL